MENIEILNSIKKCEVCAEDETCIYYKCNCYFCEGCYKFIHDKKINAHHKKEKIDYYSPFDTKCKDHPNVPITLFCLDDKGKKFYNHCYIYVI